MKTRIVFKPPKLPPLAAILILLLLATCTSSTRITGSWKSPEATKTYQNIVVAALTENILARQKVETDMQTSFRPQPAVKKALT